MVAGQEYSHDEFVDVLMVTLEQQLVVLDYSLTCSTILENLNHLSKKIYKILKIDMG